MCDFGSACSAASLRLSRRAAGAGALALLAAGRSVLAAGVLLEPVLRLPPQDGGAPRIALTLDACPGGFDMRVGQALVEQRIPATIFVTRLWLRRNPAALAFLLAHRDLFALENHGANHVPPVLGSGTVYGLPVAGTLAAIETEVTNGAAAVTAATGVAPRWYRGATGRYSPEAIPVIDRLGYGVAGYSLNADTGASLPAPAVTARIARAADGDVIVGHINQPNRPSGPGIIAGALALRQRGFGFAWLPGSGGQGV